MDRPIDAVFRRPPRWQDRRVVARALWDSLRRSSPRTPDSVRALDDVAWSRASVRAFGTRWCTTRLAPALLARTGVDLSAESASIVVPVLCRLLAGAGRSVPLVGGLAALVDALAEPLRLRLGCRALDLEATSEGVRIRYESGGREGIVLADAVVMCLENSTSVHQVAELDDGYSGGYCWNDVIDTVERICQRRVIRFSISKSILKGIAICSITVSRLTGNIPMFTPGKVCELRHHNWVCDNATIHGAIGWMPKVTLDEGLRRTFGWGREANASARSDTTTSSRLTS